MVFDCANELVHRSGHDFDRLYLQAILHGQNFEKIDVSSLKRLFYLPNFAVSINFSPMDGTDLRV